jgi:hypothetical protein
MEVRLRGQLSLVDLRGCGCSEDTSPSGEIGLAIFRCWHGPKKRSERQAMHDAPPAMRDWAKCKGIQINPPKCVFKRTIHVIAHAPAD